MRARAALISSFGTTGILVAAALLMLAVVSALVAFRGWPGGTGESIASVPVTQQAGAPVELRQVRTVTAPRAVKLAATVASRSAPARASTTGLVKAPVVSGPGHVVKVPRGVHMTLPPVQTPYAPQNGPTMDIPDRNVPIADDDPQPELLPDSDLPPGAPASPEDVEQTVSDVVGPLPSPGEDESGPQVVVSPSGPTMIGVTLAGTTIALGLR